MTLEAESPGMPGSAHADRRLFFAALFAHGSARVLSKVASAPIERVKVCLQVGVQPALTASGQASHRGKLPGVFIDIVHQQGYRGLWRGSATHLGATCLGGAARLSALRTTQMWAMPGGDRHYRGFESYLRRCAFLYAAGAGALLAAYPLDVAYTCLSADNTHPRTFRGVWHFLKITRREHGVLSFYRGFHVCLLSALPFVAIATGVHDLLAPLLLKRMGQPPAVDERAAHPGDLFWLVRDGAPVHLYPWNLLVGAAAGLTAQTATYPLDTLRRRLQHSCTSARSQGPKTIWACAEQLYKEGGWRAFYRGIGLNVLKLGPEVVVLCGVYFVINASGNFLA
eukprot:TRINITY_DN63188_c0_g1_i1.p1 TRINITY_DN63188_c0_g1~~TRINITY_DN63188_c0_g1_i1.p1  ORF type:complete len:340 (+),score=46.27 TRINITY_DN63188_c0_g1_i1:75-1094(+)